MLRRHFMKLAGALAVTPAVNSMAAPSTLTSSSTKEIYEWRVYTLTGEGSALDSFFRDVLIPAYSRKGIVVGAFTLYKKEDTEKRMLLFIYPDISSYHKIKRDIWKDNAFRKEAQAFYDATAPTPAYVRFDSYLSEAFDKIPVHKKADKNRTLFEIRTYYSPNEEANKRKVAMFNEKELAVFDKVGINPVFYGDILAGPGMPALLYLTWYKDEATRTTAWKAFGGHPEWQAMKDLPEYAYTATKVESTLLSPLPYSQL